MQQIARICSIAIAAFLMSPAVIAHTKLDTSIPSDGAEVAAPSEITLEFSEPVHVTAIVVQAKGSEAEQPMGEIPEGPAESFAIPVARALAPGEYSVSWRAVSADTHIVSGTFGFVVGEAAAPDQQEPQAADE